MLRIKSYLSILFIFLASNASAATMYAYTGGNFSYVFKSTLYPQDLWGVDTSDHISAYLVFENPLPANLDWAPVTPTTWAITDGYHRAIMPDIHDGQLL